MIVYRRAFHGGHRPRCSSENSPRLKAEREKHSDLPARNRTEKVSLAKKRANGGMRRNAKILNAGMCAQKVFCVAAAPCSEQWSKLVHRALFSTRDFKELFTVANCRIGEEDVVHPAGAARGLMVLTGRGVPPPHPKALSPREGD